MARKSLTYEEKLAKAVDDLLLDLIKNGREVLDKEGCPILDPMTGEPVRKKATAADIREAVKRVAASGNKAPVGAGAVEEIRKAMESGELKLAGGGRLPPAVDEEEVA